MREYPTLLLLIACYFLWGVATTILPEVSLPAAVLLVALTGTLHASLTHEVIHGHPFPGRPGLNALLVAPALTLAVPFARFRDTHLAHHQDARLTDPHDDPESNYLDPAVWATIPGPLRFVLSFNNTLLGRLTIGPALGLLTFVWSDLRALRHGDRRVLHGWLRHLPEAGIVVLWLLTVGRIPFWAYGLGAYGALSILRIRTFLEHQAHDRASGRTAIVEDRGPLALLFLNNNLHVVHHMHPRVAWYALPRLYAENRARYTRRNGGYVYRSYVEVFARYLLRRKDPVPHPFARG